MCVLRYEFAVHLWHFTVVLLCSPAGAASSGTTACVTGEDCMRYLKQLNLYVEKNEEYLFITSHLFSGAVALGFGCGWFFFFM